jgi:tetratricopeptide (TPR) repeat protein/tRNA A-37 threonylcarbamoyl transferase component Bud32
VPGAEYKKGDVIGQNYEVYGVLGTGGFGIVYLVENRGQPPRIYAFKTFRDEHLADTRTRERFRKEAAVWIELERHPYVVRAHFVDEIAGRLFIALEFIAPDENGLNTLEGYLRQQPPDLAQSLRWGIQFCYGMEYAYSKGIRCHRDIKPANIMIASDRTVRITDFGLAGVLSPSQATSGIRLYIQQGTVGLSSQTVEGTGFGTPTHMPPEQFTDAASCDERSDIYSLGVVLFQMASRGQLPFLAPLPKAIAEEESARFWREMHRLHATNSVPELVSPLSPITRHCLEKKPDRRYQSFKELREDLERLLKRVKGETTRPPSPAALDAGEWNNKGISLANLGRDDEAICCYDKALGFAPRLARAWGNKGLSLHRLGRIEEALRHQDKALELDPQDALAWNNKGICLASMGRCEEAIRCYDKVLDADAQNAKAWANKAECLRRTGRNEEALRCIDKALKYDSRLAPAWSGKGIILRRLGRYEEALRCHDKALELDPQNATRWTNKGASLGSMGKYEEAIRCYDRALELDPQQAAAWSDKGAKLGRLGRIEEALRCHDKAVELAPQDPLAWVNKGSTLSGLSRHEEALRCYDRASELDPSLAAAWSHKGSSLGCLGRKEEAIRCYDRALELDPRDAASWNDKGTSLDGLGRYGEALQCYDRALQLDQGHAPAWNNKGGVLGRLGRTGEALQCYDRALELDAGYTDAWVNRGFHLVGLGHGREDCRNAVRCFDKALELDPRYALAWYGKGLALEEQNTLRGHAPDGKVTVLRALGPGPRAINQEAERAYKRFIALAGERHPD